MSQNFSPKAIKTAYIIAGFEAQDPVRDMAAKRNFMLRQSSRSQNLIGKLMLKRLFASILSITSLGGAFVHASEPVDEFMQAAIEEAEKGLSSGGIPIGSVLVYEGKIIGRGHNQRMQKGSAIHHGEMNCLENAGRLPAEVYQKATIYTTLSPCPMCSGAIRLYKIGKVVIGENETFMGDEEILKNAGVALTVLNNERCKELMRE